MTTDGPEPVRRPPELPAATERRLLTLEHEASLQTRLLAREERALVELVDIATPWLLGVAYAMLSDRDEAEEVVQETFTIAWRRVDLFDRTSGRLIPWLLRIARNRAIDRLRGHKRRLLKARRLMSFGALGEGRASPVEPDETARPGWHVHEAVHGALRDLPDEQRTVIQLAYFEGLTQSEIAGRLGIPLGTVKTRLRLGFDKLRGSLASIKDWVV
jgi:RNA polymerase sigma-70 factor (ECF subfamily)